jgi:signal transduction histidine kinase
MELGRIERLAMPGNPHVVEAVAEGRQLVDDVVRAVRDLALGLRPSMLDDFGLQPALEWHVRDFIRRYGLHVDLAVEGAFDGLPDQHRTCIYRAVQEALTNCVRHARATRIDVSVTESPAGLHVAVVDNGIGIDPVRRGLGLGLRGIEERVRELEGSMTITRNPGGGTTLSVDLPIPDELAEAPLARAAG